MEQRRPKFRLERADRIRHRGLRNAALFRRAREAEFTAEYEKVLHLVQGHQRSSQRSAIARSNRSEGRIDVQRRQRAARRLHLKYIDEAGVLAGESCERTRARS